MVSARRAFLAVTGAVVLLVAPAFPSHAVDEQPTRRTPHVHLPGDRAGTNLARAGALVGDTFYAGGAFQTVHAPDMASSASRANLVAWDADTGAVTAFDAGLDGEVHDLLPAPDGGLYVCGEFTAPDRGLVLVDAVSGRPRAGFDAGLRGPCRDLALVRGHLLVGTRATLAHGALLSLDPSTGRPDDWPVPTLSGQLNGTTAAQKVVADPAGGRVVVLGSFTHAAGLARRQAALLAASDAGLTVTSWAPPLMQQACIPSTPVVPQDVAWSTSGDRFVIVTTGSYRAGSLCDSVSAWSATAGGPAAPLWTNYTGGDSLYAAATVGSQVLVGGHFQWLDNPVLPGVPCADGVPRWAGEQCRGPGAVVRESLAALDMATGRVLPWSPARRPRGHGVEAIVPTERGVMVLGDHVRAGRVPVRSGGISVFLHT